jgi:hypothetical protein
MIIIYVIGGVVSLVLGIWAHLRVSSELTVTDLAIILFASLFSWFALLAGFVIWLGYYGEDFVIYKKKK